MFIGNLGEFHYPKTVLFSPKCNVALFELGVQQKWNTLPPQGLFITPAEPLLMAAGATASRCIAVIKDICSALFSGFSMARPMELCLGRAPVPVLTDASANMSPLCLVCIDKPGRLGTFL